MFYLENFQVFSRFIMYVIESFCFNMYCSTMCNNCTVTAMRKLRISYNNSLRRLLNTPKHNSASELFVNLNIKLFGGLLRNNIHSFLNRLQCSRNLLLSSICKNTIPLYSNIWSWWIDILIL